ncbi:ABC transporter permease [Nitratireductor soli]|uniref:ABC transporter permease n=1 Tax=Nitratireductor soli TaxID=1670619 RepID=UPI00065E49FA|nr:ABC transporter permease [Nitratireductor soli]
MSDVTHLHGKDAAADPQPTAGAAQQDRAAQLARRLYPVLAIALFLIVWELAVAAFSITQLILPAPSAVFGDIVANRDMYMSFSVPTLVEVLAGFAVAAVAGIALAVAVSFSGFMRRTLYPLLISSQMVPKIAIAPVLIIWFGTELEAKVLITMLIAFFPIMVATMVGLAAVDADMVRLFRSMGAGPFRTFTKLRLPAALPNIFAGLKLGMTMALTGAIVAEFVASNRGLGYYLLYANGQLNTTGVFAALFILTAMGVVLYYAVEAVERMFILNSLSKDTDPGQATI